jgi:ATP-dependent helicase/nuclease subunit B
MAGAARLHTIHPSAPFLPTLVAALLDGRLIAGHVYRDDPLALADLTIYLPTRRAVRLAGAAFRQAMGGAALLPTIRAISDSFEDAEADELSTPAELDLPPEMTGAERQLILTRLVTEWRRFVASDRLLTPSGEALAVPASTADALRLAADLLALMDQAALEGVDWSGLRTLVPDEYAAWWQLTLTFLEIAAETLPAVIAERGRIDPASRRHTVIADLARRWRERPPRGPVIVAGSTGSVSSTAELMAAVLALPAGAVVLPGLDLDGPADVFEAARDDPSHAQHTMACLLARLGVGRDEVLNVVEPDDIGCRRARLVARAMVPAAFTDRWPAYRADLEADGAATVAALAGLRLVVAAGEAEAALAAAVALRETLETPGATAMLVTPDRTAAKRVIGELARFGVAAEDTAGVPLPQSPFGALALLIAAVVAEGYPAVKLVSLFAHPEVRLGLEPARVRAAGRALELEVLRGPRLAGTIAALSRAAAGLDADVALIVDRLAAAVAPLEALRHHPGATLADFIDAERRLLDSLTASVDAAPRPVSRAETLLLGTLADYAAGGAEALPLDLAAWPGTLKAIVGNLIVRIPARRSPVTVTGPLEARLMSVDRLVLLGLNEGTWPASLDTGPWLSRPMRRGLGLNPPEVRIGLAAHDFAQSLGTRDVVLIRAARSGGAPTVPTRFLLRLTGLIGEAATARLIAAGAPYLDWARRLDDRPTAPRFTRPEPKPPLAARPRELSVTEIETLIRDPYAVYARRVLKLAPLSALGELPDFGTRGTLIHAVIGAFVESWTGPWDGTAVAALRAAGRDRFQRDLAAYPEMLALWLPRFEALAEFLITAFEACRAPVSRHVEIAGRLVVDDAFVLKGRADRIDVLGDGRVSIVDFKTGQAPTDRQIAAQMTPQLALEAVIARHGGFEALGRREAAELVHVVLRGLPGRDDTRVYTGVKDGPTLEETISEAEERLRGLVAAYGRADKGYLSRARPFKRSVPGDYDHLARVAEWQIEDDEAGGEA